MASQIILLPQSVLASIISCPETPRMVAFGTRDMRAIPVSSPTGGSVLRIEVDRLVHCPEISNRLDDDVYAVLLATERSAGELPVPEPLPTCLVLSLLKEVETALTELPRLPGHEKLEIATAIRAARAAPATVRDCHRRPVMDWADATLPALASELQAQLQPALDVLDGKLASYRDELRRSRLEAAVVRLGLQAELGAFLRLDPVEGGFLPRLVEPHRHGGFHELWRTTCNKLAGFEACLDSIHRAARDGSSWLAEDALLPLQGTLLSGLVPPDRCGRFRSPAMRICSPSNGALHPLALPAEGVPQALEAFARRFDSRLWSDLNPLLRAGLAHIELAAIHPFGDGNGRLARLILQAMLIEDRLPGLPLEAILAWNRDYYLERVDAAIRKADLLSFMQFLAKAVEKSIELGRYFMQAMEPVRDALLRSFSDGGGRFAIIAAEYAGSLVLGPDAQLAQRTFQLHDLSRHLQQAGFHSVTVGGFELLGHRMDVAYACPAARDLLIAPPARM